MLSCDDSLSIDTLSLNDSLVLAILVSTIFTQCVFEIDKGKVRVSIIKIMERLTWKNLGVNTQTRFGFADFIVFIVLFRSEFNSFSEITNGGTNITIFPKVLR